MFCRQCDRVCRPVGPKQLLHGGHLGRPGVLLAGVPRGGGVGQAWLILSSDSCRPSVVIGGGHMHASKGVRASQPRHSGFDPRLSRLQTQPSSTSPTNGTASSRRLPPAPAPPAPHPPLSSRHNTNPPDAILRILMFKSTYRPEKLPRDNGPRLSVPRMTQLPCRPHQSRHAPMHKSAS